MDKHTVKICSWNCKGYRSRNADIRVLLKEENIQVLMLQETHLPSSNNIKIPGFKIYRHDPTIGRQGGLATLVAANLFSQEIPLNTNLQLLAIRIGGAYPITICNVYLENNLNIDKLEVENVIRQLPKPFILAGDFNAHSNMWGSPNSDKRGQMVESLIEDLDLYMFNDDQKTYMDARTGNTDSIDLVIATPGLSHISQFYTSHFLYGSDHFPLFITLFPGRSQNYDKSKKWKFKNADWGLFQRTLTEMPAFKVQNQERLQEELLNYIVKSTLTAAHNAIPTTSHNMKHPPIPWWDDNCKTALRLRRKALKRFQANTTQENLTCFRVARSHCRTVFTEAKRNSWRTYISTLNKNTTISDIWKKVKTINGRNHETLPFLTISNKEVTNPQEVADILANHFAKVSSDQSYSLKFQNKKKQDESRDISFCPSPDQTFLEHYNAKLTLWELETAIKSLKHTAPGPDQIHNLMIKHFTPKFKQHLLNLYNYIWEKHKYPESWRDSILIPLLKPGKTPADPASYRPIALSNTLGKLLEKLVNSRLIWELESKNIFSNHQNGFRKNRSTIDNLTRLTTYIQDGFINNEETIGVFFDCEKAYDRTWRYSILLQLEKHGFKGNLPIFIKNFLSERRFRVRVGNKLSQSNVQENGVPQGAVLSVTLFLLAVNDVGKVLPQYIEKSLFVDDIAVLFRTKDRSQTVRVLQSSVNRLVKWSEDHGFSFSPSKTICIRFSRKNASKNNPQLSPPLLSLNGQIIPTTDKLKYLGIVLDRKLTWTNHIEYIRSRCQKDMNLLRMLRSLRWGADRQTLLRIYYQLVRSKIDYGCTIYGSAKQKDLQKLEPIQNACIRLATGAFKTSPVESLQVESLVPPLTIRRDLLLLRFGSRLRQFPHNMTSKLFTNPLFAQKYDRKPHLPKPPGIRFKNLITSYGLQTMQQPSVQIISEIPPYSIPRPSITFIRNTNSKSETQPEIYHQTYRRYKAKHADAKHIYTDASKNQTGIGCAFIIEDIPKQFKCNSLSSICTAELEAIYRAVEYAIREDLGKVVVYTDSQSALKCIDKLYCQNLVAWKILSRVYQSKLKVHFCWIPSHIGIKQNEKADKLAKSAVLHGDQIQTTVTAKDLDIKIKKVLHDKWQTQWTNSSNDKLKYIKPLIQNWKTSYRTNRHEETTLTRLRIGHTRLTHGYLMTKQDRPNCTLCGQPLTVYHILCDCPQMDNLRIQNKLSTFISEILKDDETAVQTLFTYLKETNLTNEI